MAGFTDRLVVLDDLDDRRLLRGRLAEIVAIALEGGSPDPTAALTKLAAIGLRQDHRRTAVKFFHSMNVTSIPTEGQRLAANVKDVVDP